MTFFDKIYFSYVKIWDESSKLTIQLERVFELFKKIFNVHGQKATSIKFEQTFRTIQKATSVKFYIVVFLLYCAATKSNCRTTHVTCEIFSLKSVRKGQNKMNWSNAVQYNKWNINIRKVSQHHCFQYPSIKPTEIEGTTTTRNKRQFAKFEKIVRFEVQGETYDFQLNVANFMAINGSKCYYKVLPSDG